MVGQKAVKDALRQHQIELPSWAFGNSGTRFKVFGQPGVPRDPYEKADDAAQVHKYTGVAPVMAVHIPWDKVDDYAALSAHAHGNGIKIGAVNANVFQDDDYKLGIHLQPRPQGPQEGAGPPAGVRRHHGRDRQQGPEAVVRRRHQLPGPGRHRRPPGPARRGARRRLRAPGGRAADAAGVQAVRAVLLHHRRARLGHGPAALPGARRQGAGRGGHRPPRAGREHRVHRRAAAQGGQARRLRLQQPLLRRRRPDGRRRRPVPAVPHHARGRQGRRPLRGPAARDNSNWRGSAGWRCGSASHRTRHRVHARPVPQHRAEDPRPDPLGHERPGSGGQGAARRRRGAARGPARGRRPRGERGRSWTPTTPTSGRCSPSCAKRWASRPTRSGRTWPPGTPRRSCPSESADRPPAGEPESVDRERGQDGGGQDDGPDLPGTSRQGRRRAAGAVQPPGQRPEEHQLRRR